MIDAGHLAAASLVVILGSIIQAASGVGAGFIVVPIVAWIDLSLVPAPMIFASMALSGIMSWRERGAIDTRRLPAVFMGLLPGAAAGAWILKTIPSDSLGVMFGVVILLAVVLTGSGLSLPLNRITALVCGAVSGAMGASTGIGAPVLALLYQHAGGAKVRSTLAVLYSGASVMILAILAAVGKFTPADALAGGALMPAFLIGYLIANRFRLQLDRGTIRPAVLGLSTAAAIALLVKSL